MTHDFTGARKQVGLGRETSIRPWVEAGEHERSPQRPAPVIPSGARERAVEGSALGPFNSRWEGTEELQG